MPITTCLSCGERTFTIAGWEDSTAAHTAPAHRPHSPGWCGLEFT